MEGTRDKSYPQDSVWCALYATKCGVHKAKVINKLSPTGTNVTTMMQPSYDKRFSTLLRVAMFQPDMPTNTGTVMRMCACMGVGFDIIEPCGFPLDGAKLRRSAMDYIDSLDWNRHASWEEFVSQLQGRRIVLLTTKADCAYHEFSFKADDVIMTGRESAGVPDFVHDRADARICIPLRPPLRSLNVAISAAMALGEAIRQVAD